MIFSKTLFPILSITTVPVASFLFCSVDQGLGIR